MAMEFAQLISPTGAWGKVWLAAHWDRKLKKQDYEEIDLRSLLEHILAKRALASLRTTGHLLVGACKILSRKSQFLEDEAMEVRTRLVLTFSSETDVAAVPAGAADADAPVLREVRAELEAADPAALLGGKRHVARLEDITLRPPPTAQAGLEDLTAEERELFGAMSGAELELAINQLRDFLPGAEADGLGGLAGFEHAFDTQPLVAFADAVGNGDAAMPIADDEAVPVPLVFDGLPPDADIEPLAYPSPVQLDDDEDQEAPPLAGEYVDQDVVIDDVVIRVDPVGEDVGGEDGHGHVVPGGPPAAKRRRRVHVILDETPEFSKEAYQAFVNDRSAITRKTLLDQTVLLPHYSPILPSFTTTFEVCSELCEAIRGGSEIAEKRRRLLRIAEMGGAEHAAALDAFGVPRPPGVPDFSTRGDSGVLSPLLSPIPREQSGLMSPDQVPPTPAPSEAKRPKRITEKMLLENAPGTLGAVVTGSMDEEDQTGNAAARVGYSGRTEKMHRFLAKEFSDNQARALSYSSLVRSQAGGRRELIAGCFFELLVLKTNGVINLQQEAPLADIKIAKATQWAK